MEKHYICQSTSKQHPYMETTNDKPLELQYHQLMNGDNAAPQTRDSVANFSIFTMYDDSKYETHSSCNVSPINK